MNKDQNRPIQLLVIDDDQDLLTTTQLQLRMRGYQVECAANGAEGIELAMQTLPDVILIDIGLPDMEGIEVVQRLRSYFKTACAGLIMLTARSDQVAMSESVNAGADDYILKPYELDELCSRIEMVRLRTLRNLERNPLTGLPGNNVIRTELQRRIDNEAPFCLGYIDIDHFKSFNDKYGPEKGDEAIIELGKILISVVEKNGSSDDFLGHIGGDDFVFLATSERIHLICEELFIAFDNKMKSLYAPDDFERGGIEIEDRDGKLRLHPVSTLSVGIVSNTNVVIDKAQRAFELATDAKQRAKNHDGNRIEIWGDTTCAKEKLLRILIVEDDSDVAFNISYRLKREGYQCQTVSDVPGARDALAAFKPDLLLVDIVLPGFENGNDLVEQIRYDKTQKRLPIIIISALDSNFDQLLGSELGADLYLTKPFDLDQIVNSVDLLLGEKRPSELPGS